MLEADYGFLKRKIHQAINIDLNDYKANQMMRRLDGFISRSGTSGVIQYCSLLEKNFDEREKLRNFLTINVSEFYRDTMHFETLRKVIFPELLKNNHHLHIWSAGCSDGQEPYTIAFLLAELSPYGRHRILATDIDTVSIKKATAGGPYRPEEIRGLPQGMTAKYLKLKENGYWITDPTSNKIEFKQHNLMQDPFEKNFDMIICRNVAIYFSDEAKQKLKMKFLNSLKDNGVLFIGATETILNAEEIGLQRLSPCFYKKIVTSNRRKILAASGV